MYINSRYGMIANSFGMPETQTCYHKNRVQTLKQLINFGQLKGLLAASFGSKRHNELWLLFPKACGGVGFPLSFGRTEVRLASLRMAILTSVASTAGLMMNENPMN